MANFSFINILVHSEFTGHLVCSLHASANKKTRTKINCCFSFHYNANTVNYNEPATPFANKTCTPCNRQFPSCLFTSISKWVLVHNLSYGNEFDLHQLHVHCLANKTHFHMNSCALGLVLKQRQKATRKWTIALSVLNRVQIWYMTTFAWALT